MWRGFPRGRALKSVNVSSVSNYQKNTAFEAAALASPLAKNTHTFVTMATASKIKLDTSHRPVFAVPELSQESADKASELLQENHDKHHIFFNASGFHNHAVHHILSLYALGAPPSVIQSQYDANDQFKRKKIAQDQKAIADMRDEAKFKQYLGENDRYQDFLEFFREEVDNKGWQDVLNEYLFSGTERADDMLARNFGGFLHPLIHLGFGIEFGQPAIITESLAQTASHTRWMGDFLFPAEEQALKNKKAGKPSKSLFELLEEIRGDEKLVGSIRNEDGNKLRDGVMVRAPQEMASYAAQYYINPEDLDSALAEMTDFCAYITVASQRPPKQIKMDFFLMHDTNCSIFFPRFITDPSSSWLSTEAKVRLLEWKARTDLAQFVARGSPALLPDEITSYAPKASNGKANGVTNGAGKASGEWDALFHRVCRQNDDSHAVKLVRAMANGEQRCANGAKKPKTTRVTDDMWVKMAHMVVDSTEGQEIRWLRSTGLPQAWADVPDRTVVASSTL